MLISVIIPVLNGQAFIEKAITSAMTQHEVLEVIVIDNGSTDNTVEICKEISLKHKKVKVINASNKNSPAHARNAGIQIAKGKYLTFLDSDDYFLPGRFKKTFEILSSDSTIEGVYTTVQNEFINNVTIDSYKQNEILFTDGSIDPEFLFQYLIQDTNSTFSIISLTLKKEAINKIGLFDEQFYYSEDIDFIYRAALYCKIVGLLELPPLIKRRVHGQNITMNENKEHKITRSNLTQKWYLLMIDHGFGIKNNLSLLRRKLGLMYDTNNSNKSILERIGFKSIYLIQLFINNPILIKRVLIG